MSKSRRRKKPKPWRKTPISILELEASLGLPSLEGTRRQVRWARAIRQRFINRFNRQLKAGEGQFTERTNGGSQRVFERIKSQRSASKWINYLKDHRFDPLGFVREVARGKRPLYERREPPPTPVEPPPPPSNLLPKEEREKLWPPGKSIELFERIYRGGQGNPDQSSTPPNGGEHS